MSGHDHEHQTHHEHNEHGRSEHVHSESCACGHSHDEQMHHAHVHDAHCGCHMDEHEAVSEIRVECHLHDEARVVSGVLTVFADYEKLKPVLSLQLESLAKAVQERGGIVGHIKAACELKLVEMFSVTDVAVSVKAAPGQDIKINLAAIVFAIAPDEAKTLVTSALEAVKAAV